MTISLTDIKNEIDPANFFERELPRTIASARSEPVMSTAENHNMPALRP